MYQNFQGMIPQNVGLNMPFMNMVEQMRGSAQPNFPMEAQLYASQVPPPVSSVPIQSWPTFSDIKAFETSNQNQPLGGGVVPGMSLQPRDSDLRMALCGPGSDRVPLGRGSDFDLRGPSLREHPNTSLRSYQYRDRSPRRMGRDNSPVSNRVNSHHRDARGYRVESESLARREISPVPDRRFRESSPPFSGSDRMRRERSPDYLVSDRRPGERSPYQSTSYREHRGRSPDYLSSDSRYRERSPADLTSNREYRERSQVYPGQDSQYRERSPVYPGPDSRYRERSPGDPAPSSRYRERSPVHPPAHDSRYMERSPVYPGPDSRYREGSPVYRGPDSRYRERSPVYPGLDSRFRDRSPVYPGPDSQYRERSPVYSAPDSRCRERSPNYSSSERRLRDHLISDRRHRERSPNYPIPNDKNDHQRNRNTSLKYDRIQENYPKHEDNVYLKNNRERVLESGYRESNSSNRREMSGSWGPRSSRQSDNLSCRGDRGIETINTSRVQDFANKSMDKEYQHLKNKGMLNNPGKSMTLNREEMYKPEIDPSLIGLSMAMTEVVNPNVRLAAINTSLSIQWGGLNSSQAINPQNVINQPTTSSFPPPFTSKEIKAALKTTSQPRKSTSSKPNFKPTNSRFKKAPKGAGSSFLNESFMDQFDFKESESEDEDSDVDGSSLFKKIPLLCVMPVKPHLRLDRSDTKSLRKMLADLLDDLSQKHALGIKQPQLRFNQPPSVWGRAFKISCTDDFTYNWMLNWKPPAHRGMELQIRPSLKIIHRVGILFKGERNLMDVELTLKQLCAQNKGLDTSLWVNISQHVDPQGTGVFLVFDIDNKSKKLIREMKYSLYYQLSTVLVKSLQRGPGYNNGKKMPLLDRKRKTNLATKVKNLISNI